MVQSELNNVFTTPSKKNLDDENGDLTNTQWFFLIVGTCYAITFTILFLTAWCHSKRAAQFHDRRNKRFLSNQEVPFSNRSETISSPSTVANVTSLQISNSSSIPKNIQGNRVSPDQLLEDGIVSEAEVNRSLVIQTQR